MKKIYVAGPMRGYENYNFDAFDATEKRLTEEGYIVINPASMDRFYEGWGQYVPDDFVVDDAFIYRCMRRDLDAVFDVDAVYMLLGWEDSEGARCEHSLAVCLNKHIMYEVVI